ncbi:putative DNA-binding transcriptional regulator YafY [Rhizobium leguminosarum]|uniref:helix-turn-helix transcriptional regulator n=3 Tax=Rhizobium leguminosarum TaxID=384 RepID=UPI0018578650|nr:WYL domain-containing protein [Rhizobium leguminosarum]MBB4339887.1 putative DNA-binding transcriptional regulator YafY [Rhizobium leguminosarum]
MQLYPSPHVLRAHQASANFLKKMIDSFKLFVIIKSMVNLNRKSTISQTRSSRGRPRKEQGAPPAAEQLRRLHFIEKAALWTGQIGRRAVAATFDVSVSHVTLDFQRYREMAPANLVYDVVEKCFRASESFAPVFGSDTDTTLDMLAATATLAEGERARLLGFTPSVEIVQGPSATIDRGLLATVCRALTAGRAIAVNYQSMKTPHSVERLFWPSALIYTGHRWLVRGWDERHTAFRDLAIARILGATQVDAPTVPPRDDKWHNRVKVVIGLAKHLSDGQAEITAREFGMSNTKMGFTVEIYPRQAMVPYLLDHMRLRPSDAAVTNLPLRVLNFPDVQKHDRSGIGGQA